jgi:hypothetical protein
LMFGHVVDVGAGKRRGLPIYIYRTVNDYTAHSINHVTYLFLALHVTIFLRFIALATSAQLLCLWCHYMSLAELAGGEIEGTTPKLAYWCLLMMLCLFGKKNENYEELCQMQNWLIEP